MKYHSYALLLLGFLCLSVITGCQLDNDSNIKVTPNDASLIDSSTNLYQTVQRPMSDEILYFLIPDRFNDGKTSNNCGDYQGECKDNDVEAKVTTHGYLSSDKGYYHGGDIVGLTNKLDYIQQLGVTAIWVGPIFKNKPVQDDSSNLYGKSSAYHGYWITDFLNVDPHLGTNEEFSALVTAAHARGIKVFMDIITNHTADVIQYVGGDSSYQSKQDVPYKDINNQDFDDSEYAYHGQGDYHFPTLNEYSFPYQPSVPDAEKNIKNPSWLNNPLYYHNRGNTTFVGENSLYGDFFGLDDLFTERKEVVDGMIDIYKHWITTYKVDGFRIDTTKHVNLGFWQVFGPAMQQAAKQAGIENFFSFGEVYSPDVEFLSAFSTKGKLPSTIDFAFQENARAFASQSKATSTLRDFFAKDDYYTDADSNAYVQPTFLGNHDMGRISGFINKDNPNASDSEKLGRSRLAHGLMFFARGQPVIYYGDEQGFTGDSEGDKDAREDMFPSKVASYNDNILIGTTARTSDDNFDTKHPLYLSIQQFAELYKAHPTLRKGTQIHRYAEDNAGVYAFSRFSRDEKIEYIVALNNSLEAKTVKVNTYSANAMFKPLLSTSANTISSDANQAITLTIPALDLVIYQATTPVVVTNTSAPQLNIALVDSTASEPQPADNNALTLYTKTIDGTPLADRLAINATLDTNQYASVHFMANVNGVTESLGTDSEPPYRVFYDASTLPTGATVSFTVTATTLDGKTVSSELKNKTISVIERPVTGPKYPYAVVHYQRTNNDYGSDEGNCWGVHAWGDAIVTQGDWAKPVCFVGEDSYGRFAYLPLESTDSVVNFIVHMPSGDNVGEDREVGGDRNFDPKQYPEIWLKQDDATVYNYNPDVALTTDKTKWILHYRRPKGDYTGWGLHVWGDTTDNPTWESPLLPVRFDAFGAVFEVNLKMEAGSISYLIHNGDTKDPGTDQLVNLKQQGYEVWQLQSADTQKPYINANPDVTKAIIHYRRLAGDYTGWGLHVWGDTTDSPTWEKPLLPVRYDAFGAVFEVNLQEKASALNYIIHNGDNKDPEGDLSMTFAVDGYEVWQVQGAKVENPRVLPLRPNN